MNRVFDRVIILAMAALYITLSAPEETIYVVLVGIIMSGLMFYFYGSVIHAGLCILAAMLIAINDTYIILFIPLIYETVSDYMDGRRKMMIVPAVVLAVYVIKYITMDSGGGLNGVSDNPARIIIIATGVVLSVYLAYSTSGIVRLKHINLRMRDDNEEFRKYTNEKNELLRTQQDNEIALATLKERNRIAREIHDNVGHLLSRAIVQMGALQAVYREAPFSDAIKQVSATLDESMDNIRRSVHDLHNESFDLKRALSDMAEKSIGFSVCLNYDMGDDAPLQVKYCAVSIVSEALHNVEKHSDATRVQVTVAEHPAFYQLIINDNGHPGTINESGIGLHNMESRIKELDGSISFSTDKGFRIFGTIPKKGRKR